MNMLCLSFLGIWLNCYDKFQCPSTVIVYGVHSISSYKVCDTSYSDKITECAKPWDLPCCASHLLGYWLFYYHVWSYYLFNLLNWVSYFPGCLHGNVATQLFLLLCRCILSGLIVPQMLSNLRVPDTLLLQISNYCCSVTTSLFWRALTMIKSKIVKSMTVAKVKFLSSATELVQAKPNDVLMSELSVIQ